MNLFKNKITGLLLIAISILFVINFSGCASTTVENTVDSPKDSKIEKTYDHVNYEKFCKMFDEGNHTNGEVLDFLTDWNEKEPENPELARAYFELFTLMSMSPIEEDVSSSIPEGEPYGLVPIEGTDYYDFIYPGFYVHTLYLINGISMLEQAVALYPYRLDLWNYLYTTLGNFYLFNETEIAAMEFLDVVEEVEKNHGDWYDLYNEKVYFEKDYYKANTIIDMITTITFLWINNYPYNKDAIKAAKNILTRLLEIYPQNSYVYNETGLVYMSIDPELAITYFDKSYSLDNSMYSAILNAVLCTILLNDMDSYNYYTDIIYSSDNQELINYYEENMNVFFNKTN